jgi:hypothetical protein
MKQAVAKPKPPTIVCILSEREALLFEQFGWEPFNCRNGSRSRKHRHLRRTKATELVRSKRFRWVGPHAKWITEIKPMSWHNARGATGYVSQQLFPGGRR